MRANVNSFNKETECMHPVRVILIVQRVCLFHSLSLSLSPGLSLHWVKMNLFGSAAHVILSFIDLFGRGAILQIVIPFFSSFIFTQGVRLHSAQMDGDNKRIQTKLTLRRLEAHTHKKVNSFDATRHIKRWQKNCISQVSTEAFTN